MNEDALKEYKRLEDNCLFSTIERNAASNDKPLDHMIGYT